MSALTKRGIVGGIVGGLVGAALMAVLLMGAMMMMGMPALMMFTAMGAALGGSAMTGLGLHFLTSIILGAILGVGVTAVWKLRPTSAIKSTGLGILYGVVVFVVFFLPLAMMAFAPAMVNVIQMMAQSQGMPISQSMAMAKAQSLLPSVLAVAFVGHLIFGAVVGLSVYLAAGRLAREASASRTHEHTHEHDHASAEPQGATGAAPSCAACNLTFDSTAELKFHAKSAHAGSSNAM